MELLIPGLILVALMVWASTRIKRNAAAAFDAEKIETDEFVINKPEGFLHVLNDDSGLAFRAYSKDFGKIDNKDLRQATIEIAGHNESTLERIREAVVELSESVENEQTYLDGGEKAVLMETKEIRNGAEYDVFYKLATRGSRVFEVRADVLSEHKDDFSRRMEELMDGLRIK